MNLRTSVLSAVFALSLAGCGGPLKYAVKGTQLSPGSDATIVADTKKAQGMTSVEVEAKNLTPPSRLIDGGSAYVVWTRKSADVAWARHGALELDGESRNGKMVFTVPEKAFDLQVSAEKDPSAASPSGKSVFDQHVGE